MKTYKNFAQHIAEGGDAHAAIVTDYIEDYEVVEVRGNEVRVILWDAVERNNYDSHWMGVKALYLVLGPVGGASKRPEGPVLKPQC